MMKAERQTRTKRAEEGIALLISIFILMLISVVAIALIVSSGTESALAGNYRSSTAVYYAALAGVEEARSRLLPKNPSYFGTTSPGFLPSPGTPLAVGYPVYVINPLSSETVAPWDPASTFPDSQYNQEFASSSLSLPNPSPSTSSIWKNSPLNSLSFPGPFYKWVRINAISGRSLNLPVGPSYSGPPYDSTTPVFYDITQPIGSQLNISGTGTQVLELTALAVLPNGSQKLLQYLVATVPVTLPPLLAALTISGSTANPAAYHAPASNSSYAIKGDDVDCSPSAVPTGAEYPAVGVFTNTDKNTVINGIPSSPPSVRNSYTGLHPAPDVENLNTTSPSFPPSLQKPSQIDALAQSIAQYADNTFPPSGPITYPLPTFTGSSLTPLGMSATNPLTIVVNGNLDISNWSNDGYGLLLVLGNFTYDPDTTWGGIILVIGQGVVNGSHMQYKQINGAIFVAKTRDPSGNLLPDPNSGGASVQFADSMQGYGIRYSNCWIQKSQPTGSYKILSFHEISQ